MCCEHYLGLSSSVFRKRRNELAERGFSGTAGEPSPILCLSGSTRQPKRSYLTVFVRVLLDQSGSSSSYGLQVRRELVLILVKRSVVNVFYIFVEFDSEFLYGFPKSFEIKRMPNACVSHKSPCKRNRVILYVDWWWFSYAYPSGEEGCFRFRWIYENFPFLIPVLELR
ncbi:hypothetical protein TNCV_1406271 [Trichonephila clavipes]|nr:hypothetical protein TNCV_1406271 [Trichonephila clavipes]